MLKIEQFAPLIYEAFKDDKTFKMPVKGTSMLPFINDKHYVVLTKPKNIKKHDIVFYIRESGQYVLHRIYDVKKDYYVLMGDNQTFKEEPIYEHQIIAKVEAVIKGNKVHNLRGLKYRLYLFFWHNRFIRKLCFPISRRMR